MIRLLVWHPLEAEQPRSVSSEWQSLVGGCRTRLGRFSDTDRVNEPALKRNLLGTKRYRFSDPPSQLVAVQRDDHPRVGLVQHQSSAIVTEKEDELLFLAIFTVEHLFAPSRDIEQPLVVVADIGGSKIFRGKKITGSRGFG